MMSETKFSPSGPRSDDNTDNFPSMPTSPTASSAFAAAAVEAEDMAIQAARDYESHVIEPLKRDRSPQAQKARRNLMLRAVFGEFMCTTCVFAPVFLVICNNQRAGYDAVSSSALTAITLLFSSIAGIYCFSGVSGAHFNPSVTFSAWLTGKTSNRKLILYIAAQMLASVNCMIIVCCVFPSPVSLFNALIVTPPNGNDDIVRVFMMEFFLTWSLIYVAFTVAYEDAESQKKTSMSFKTVANTEGLTLFATTPQSKTGFAPFAIGFTLSALALCGGTVSGGCFNPARLFGPALFSGRWDYFYVYWAAEFLGGGSAALFIRFVHPLGKPNDDAAGVAQALNEFNHKMVTEKIRKATTRATVIGNGQNGENGQQQFQQRESTTMPSGMSKRNATSDREKEAVDSVTTDIAEV